MNNDETKSLALTTWGASTLDALQAATETDRDAIARRACDDAIADARGMAGLQGSLFEKLLVIERFGMYRSHAIKDGDVERGCESIQEFIEHAVAPVVQLHRATLFKLREAVWEAGRLLGRYGTLKTDWTNLYLLASETRRQIKGGAVLPADDYEKVSQQVAEGRLSQRELSVALQRRPAPARPKRVQEEPTCCLAATSRPARISPFDELALIAARAQSRGERSTTPRVVAGAIEAAEGLAKKLEELALLPADAWMLAAQDLGRLEDVLGEVQEASSATLAAAKATRAA